MLAVLLAGLAAMGLPQQSPTGKEWRRVAKSDAAHPAPYTQFALAGKFVKWPQAEVSTRPIITLDCIPHERAHGSKGEFLQGTVFVGTALKLD